MSTMKRVFARLAIIVTLVVQPLVYGVSDSRAASFLACDALGVKWRDVSGEWVASVGPAIFSVDGLRVTGIYNQDTWSLDLRYSNDCKHLSGRWSHRNGLEGPVIFHLDQTGCIKHARWGGSGNATCNENDSLACIHDWAFHGRAKK